MKQVEITSKVVGRGESEGFTSAIPSINLSGFALKSDLLTLEKKFSDFLNVPIIDGTINRWNELETFLAGISEDYNLLSLLNGKADKSYVDSTFVTIAGTEDVTGLHNFVNGLKIGGLPITKKQDDVVYLDANLVVRGGITMYAENEVDIPSILDSLPIASNTALGIASFDSTYFSVDSNGMVSLTSAPSSGASSLGELLNVDASIDATASVDRILYQPQGSSMWTWRELPKDGVVGNYLPLSGGTLTGVLTLTSKSTNPYIELIAGENLYGYLQINSSGTIGLGAGMSKSLCITQDGAVGICKIPSYKLDVNGDIYTTTGIKSPKFNLVTVGGIASYLQIYKNDTSWAFQCSETYAFIGQSQARSLKVDSAGHAITPVETDGRYSKFEMSGIQLFMPTSGGWTMGLSSRNSAGTEVNAIIKGYGNGQNIEKIYIGGGYTTSWMEINTSKNLLVKGGITMYSDQRKKTILNHVELSLKQIADAPLIQHYYNSDQNKTTHVGSIAQYWAKLNDWFCKLDNEGFYTMEIQNCALASAISIARHLEKYESKTYKTIRKMNKRIEELENEVERLKQN